MRPQGYLERYKKGYKAVVDISTSLTATSQWFKTKTGDEIVAHVNKMISERYNGAIVNWHPTADNRRQESEKVFDDEVERLRIEERAL